jgi:formate-dependent nitrite reductase membrane component NrfD
VKSNDWSHIFCYQCFLLSAVLGGVARLSCLILRLVLLPLIIPPLLGVEGMWAKFHTFTIDAVAIACGFDLVGCIWCKYVVA